LFAPPGNAGDGTTLPGIDLFCEQLDTWHKAEALPRELGGGSQEDMGPFLHGAVGTSAPPTSSTR